MDELLAYALVICAGFDLAGKLDKFIDELFEGEPENSDYLELEWKTDLKERLIYILNRSIETEIKAEKFGRMLAELLKPLYRETDIYIFAERMYYCIWKHLPEYLQYEEPFFILNYADDCLDYGDEQDTRALYESFLTAFDR